MVIDKSGREQLQFEVAGERVEKRLAVSGIGQSFVPINPKRP